MNIGERIRNRRKELSMSVDELADAIGKNKTTIYRYEKNRIEKIPYDVVIPLAKALDISVSHLTGSDNALANENKVNTNRIEMHKTIPYFGNVSAGILTSVDCIQEDDVRYIQIPERFLGKYINNNSLFAMTVDGESMNQIVRNGSIIIAKEMDLHSYKDGDIVIFEHDGEFSLKKYSPNTIDGYVLFEAKTNDKEIKNIVIKKDTHQDLKIYGKVIYFGTTLN